jgi:hypothetical protein
VFVPQPARFVAEIRRNVDVRLPFHLRQITQHEPVEEIVFGVRAQLRQVVVCTTQRDNILQVPPLGQRTELVFAFLGFPFEAKETEHERQGDAEVGQQSFAFRTHVVPPFPFRSTNWSRPTIAAKITNAIVGQGGSAVAPTKMPVNPAIRTTHRQSASRSSFLIP